MLKQLRQTIIKNLFVRFHNETSQLKIIEEKLKSRQIYQLPLDHFAIIDLPGPHTGISELTQLFSCLGYIVQGRDYLPDKQNDFLWLAENDSKHRPARDVLPQVVVADFRLEEMPQEIRTIIYNYAKQAPPSPVPIIQQLTGMVYLDNFHAAKDLNNVIVQYLNGRDWPLPSQQEFLTVFEFNQLLAWVLIFGRRPNHFTLAVHLIDQFANIQAFLNFLNEDQSIELNAEGGVVKGNALLGIEQAATLGNKKTIRLAGGDISINSEFVEFIWRFSRLGHQQPAHLWEDFQIGFIPQNANQIIQSLYESKRVPEVIQ